MVNTTALGIECPVSNIQKNTNGAMREESHDEIWEHRMVLKHSTSVHLLFFLIHYFL